MKHLFRTYVARRGDSATYMLSGKRGRYFIGFSIWRKGAFSLLAPIGDGVPVQVVFGDWWGPYKKRAER